MAKDVLGESERRLIQQEMFQLEDQKLALEEQYQYLFENALSGLFRIDVETNKVLTANKELLRIFGVEELVELDYLFNHYGIFEELEVLKLEEDSSDEPLTFSTPLLIGIEERMIQFSAQYQEDYHLIEGAAKDITNIVRAEKRMLEAIKDAEQANHAKSLFLANMSHEIRTPLNGIVGFAELIQRTGVSLQSEYAQKILDESDRLMTLINQLLDISKIEANQIVLESQSFLLGELIRDQVDSFRPLLDEKGLVFSIDIDEKVAQVYQGDSFRIGQIIINLVSNAVKFTSRGRIDLNVILLEERDGKDWLQFSVIDTGIGIPRDKQKAVFEKFTQADSSIERRFGGTGLGIAICKELVELMGGSISLKSEVDRGSQFTFILPLPRSSIELSKAKRVDKNEIDLHNLPPSRILLVEDYKINQDVILLHLEPFPIDIDMAENGEEAIRFFIENDYDLIIMDVHMPLLNGLEATSRIRDMKSGRDIPIIGMSASAFSSDREECRRAGMSDFLPKPVRRNKLFDHLYYWLNKKDRKDPLQDMMAWEYHLQNSLDQDNSLLRYEEFCCEIGSRDDGNMIIQGYLDSAENLKEEIERDIQTENWTRAHRNAHSLKGGALSIMADELADQAHKLEEALKEPYGRDIMPLYYEVSLCLERLNGEYHKLKKK